MKSSIISGILVLLAAIVYGQSTLIKGQVFDKNADKPLGHASISIDEFQIGTFADDKGFFELELPISENYTLVVEHMGYETFIGKFSASESKNLRLNLISEPIVIEEILVTGSPYQNVTRLNTLIDPTKNFSQSKDIGDLFKDVPGFGVIKRGGYAMDPVFRSFRNEQLNVQYDGGIQVMHACPNRMDPITTHVNPEEVDRIELIKGPFSVRYGSTMGGIINIITAKPEPGASFEIRGTIEGGYEFNGNSKLTRILLNTSGSRYSFVASGGLRDFGDFSSGANNEIPSSFKSYDYALKGGLETGKNQRIQVGWRQSFGRDILHIGLPMDTDEDNSQVLSLDYVANNLGGTLYSISFKGFLSQVDHIMDNRNRPNFSTVEATAMVDAFTAGGKLEFTLMPKATISSFLGTDFRYLARDGERIRLVKRNMMTMEPLVTPVRMVDLIWQDAMLNDWGFYFENKIFGREKWTLSTGVRLDLVQAKINDPAPDFEELYSSLNTDTEWNFSGNISVGYQTHSEWDFQLALGRGTRTASMEERYINHFQLGLDAFEYVGNPNLKPEVNHQIELSAGKKTGPFDIKASVYFSYLNQYITAAVDSSLPRKFMPAAMPRYSKRFQNIDAARQLGFEIESEWKVTDKILAYAMASLTHAQNLDWDEPLAEIPPFTTLLGVTYENDLLTTDLRGRLVARQNRIATSFGETETKGFQVFDFRMAVRPWKYVSLGAALLNIFDTNYYEHLNRGYRNSTEPGLIYEPGRNLTFYLKFDW